MSFSWSKLNYPIILCPPMDGITDNAFRELISEFGGSSAVYCEFINVKGLIYKNAKTTFELQYTKNQRPIIAQLFGNDPEDFYNASKLIVKMGFDAIDINMGCPAHKVASKGSGCALMGDLAKSKRIIEETIRGANEEIVNSTIQQFDKNPKIFNPQSSNLNPIEITCKMRLGIDSKETVFNHGMEMIESGAKAIAIHGRTLKQMYSGEADWEVIKQFCDLVKQKFINNLENKPKVFGSGDAKPLFEAMVRILTTGVDGVMIGRGCFGNPWVFEIERVNFMKEKIIEIENYYSKKSGEITLDQINSFPNIEEIKAELQNQIHTFNETSKIAIHHAELIFQDKGEKGMFQIRKHLAWYFHGFEGAKELRSKLVRVNSVNEIQEILK